MGGLLPCCKSSDRGLSGSALKTRTWFEEALNQRCLSFTRELSDLDARATRGLNAVFVVWRTINVRTLRAAAERKGEWFSVALQRQFDLNLDIARAYLDLVPFVWDEFFGAHLAALIEQAIDELCEDLNKTAARLKGAMEMLQCQPADVRESIETSLRTAGESFQIQSAEVRASLSAQIQRTRQALANGMVEAASDFMRPGYAAAASFPFESGIKKRMLDIIVQHAKQHS